MTLNNTLGFEKRKKPSIWVTSLAPFVSGDSQCKYSLWLQGNYWVKSKSDVPSDWLVQHQSLLNEVSSNLEDEGYEVEVEDANTLHLGTSAGVTIGGKPDLVVLDGQGLVVDVKTGKPRGKDRAQVNLYQALIPSKNLHGIKEVPWGRLVYRNGEEKQIPSTEIDDSFRQSVKDLLAVITQKTVPVPQPSVSECRFCKCRDRCPVAQTEAAEASELVAWL